MVRVVPSVPLALVSAGAVAVLTFVAGPADGIAREPAALDARSEVGPVAYRVVALEALLFLVPLAAPGAPIDDTPDLGADARWRAQGTASRSLAAALLDDLRAAGDGPPPAIGPPTAARRRPSVPRWALVATWEAAALARTDAARSGVAMLGVARARRAAAVPLPPPTLDDGVPRWPAALLRPPPPHPDAAAPRDPRAAGPGPAGHLEPSDAADLAAAAVAAARAGDLPRAAALWDQSAPGVLPPDAWSAAWRAETALATGRWRDAQAGFVAAATHAPAADVGGFLLERAAVAAWRGGDRGAALASARAAVRRADEGAGGGTTGGEGLGAWARRAERGALDARGDALVEPPTPTASTASASEAVRGLPLSPIAAARRRTSAWLAARAGR